MKKYTCILFPLLMFCGLITTSCNSTRLTTNQKEGEVKTFDRAFIIIHHYNDSRFYKNLVTELQYTLISNTIYSEILTLNEISLKTEDDIKKQIAEFNPQVIIEFKELRKTSTTVIIPDVYTPIEINDGRVCLIEVKDYQTNEYLWKGKLVTDEHWKSKQAARKSIRKIFESFENGNLISLR